MLQKVKAWFCALLINRPRDGIGLLALVLTFWLETCNRHSVLEAVGFLVHNPWGFVVNLLIVAAPLYLCLLSGRRLAALGVVSAVWALVGVMDFGLLLFRVTPFNGQDFMLLPDAMAIAPQYVGWVGLILILLAICTMRLAGDSYNPFIYFKF